MKPLFWNLGEGGSVRDQGSVIGWALESEGIQVQS